ncbi:hypothetical protein [Loktanella sp. SALINAS62]|uniref:hypothetical protein n=1 Tax=Loktanella sp. SALINAS62 TaxID=2706124 RepID=UPI001B8B185F|nr:hypothetical protein [Loktanella sp. SALINAS62]MBS1300831.1 hypothetical protein [Loktanella sp. SALINAS62]
MKKFFNDEDGAVTVDWVVLTATLALFPAAIFIYLSGGVSDLTTNVVSAITAEE